MALTQSESAGSSVRAGSGSRGEMTLLRGAAGLMLLLLAIGCALAFLIAAQLMSAKSIAGDSLLGEQLVAWARSATPSTRALVALGSLAIGVAALYGVGSLLRSSSLRGAASSMHVVEANEHGLLVLDNRSVAALAHSAATRVQGVYDVEVDVKSKGIAAPLQINIQANVIGGCDLRDVGRQASARAREAVERLAGLSVADVTTHLSVEEPRRFLEQWS